MGKKNITKQELAEDYIKVKKLLLDKKDFENRIKDLKLSMKGHKENIKQIDKNLNVYSEK